MASYEFKRIPHDQPSHPDRCQANHHNQQCWYQKVENSNYCPRHGGNQGKQSVEKKNLKTYLSSKWSDKISGYANSSKFQSLREEIGILRMTVEAKLNKINDETDLIIASAPLTELVKQISSSMKTCYQIEQAAGLMLDESQATNFIQECIQIIGAYVSDEDCLQAISEDMVTSLDRIMELKKSELKD